MAQIKMIASFAAVLAGALLIASGASAARLIRSQATCSDDAPANGACNIVGPTTALPITLRSLAFNAPAAGRAQVTFHASMTCENLSANPAVVDLVTQILGNQAATPTINGPGGLRHAIRFQPSDLGGMESFNLDSTRVFAVPSGRSTFYFRLSSLRFDADTVCSLYNLTFSILFI